MHTIRSTSDWMTLTATDSSADTGSREYNPGTSDIRTSN